MKSLAVSKFTKISALRKGATKLHLFAFLLSYAIVLGSLWGDLNEFVRGLHHTKEGLSHLYFSLFLVFFLSLSALTVPSPVFLSLIAIASTLVSLWKHLLSQLMTLAKLRSKIFSQAIPAVHWGNLGYSSISFILYNLFSSFVIVFLCFCKVS